MALSANQIARYAYDAGFRGKALTDAIAIALAESRGNPRAHNPVGEDSRGLWQINVNQSTSWGRDRLARYGNLYDPATNAKAAFDISSKGTNFRPWTTYAGTTESGRNNSHSKFMTEAHRAASGVLGGYTPSSSPLSSNQGSSPLAGNTASNSSGGSSVPDVYSGSLDLIQPFFDPTLAQQRRASAFDTETGIADLRLQESRLKEDTNIFRPFLNRRFKQQADKVAGDVAGRGFSGRRSGIMNQSLGDLSEEQAFTSGEFERRNIRGMEDIERAIANLTSRNIMMGGEDTLDGAARASERAVPRF